MALFNNDKFYRKQFYRHLETMYKDDGISIENIAERHSKLITKAKQLQSLQSLLEAIGKIPTLERFADGGYRELSLYRNQTEQLKHYINNFPLDQLTLPGYNEMERVFQLELTNRLLQLDAFYKSMIVVKNQKEMISGAIMGDKELSLADMQLI